MTSHTFETKIALYISVYQIWHLPDMCSKPARCTDKNIRQVLEKRFHNIDFFSSDVQDSNNTSAVTGKLGQCLNIKYSFRMQQITTYLKFWDVRYGLRWHDSIIFQSHKYSSFKIIALFVLTLKVDTSHIHQLLWQTEFKMECTNHGCLFGQLSAGTQDDSSHTLAARPIQFILNKIISKQTVLFSQKTPTSI